MPYLSSREHAWFDLEQSPLTLHHIAPDDDNPLRMFMPQREVTNSKTKGAAGGAKSRLRTVKVVRRPEW
jgi:hypothetical protein